MAKQIKEKKPESKRFLYLVTHGLFAFVKQDGYLDILMPAVPEHVNAAGRWEEVGEERLLTNGETYVLNGVRCGKLPAPKNFLTISRKKSDISSVDRMKSSFCVIRTPFPEEVKVLRALKKRSGSPRLFVGKGASQNNLTKQVFTPICCKLTFIVRDADDVSLGEIWKGSPGAEKERLHIWSEPSFVTRTDHVEMAFGMLRDMFEGLDLEINPESDRILEKEDFPDDDIDKRKTVTLQERLGVRPALHFSKIRNCFSALFSE